MTRRTMIAALAVIAATLAAPRAQGKRFITERDLLRFTWIADPQISPDGSAVVFVQVTVNEKENRYETALFAVPTNGANPPRRITSGIRDSSPRWSPDGKRLAFVRAIEKDGKVQPAQLYLLDMAGGEARAITSLTRGAGGPVWSPDGGRIAFSAATGREGQEGREKDASDVKVITRAVYRANGTSGYVDTEHHSHLFTLVVDGSAPKQITDGEFDEREPLWSPDGSTLYFTSTRVAEPYYEEAGAELFSVSAGGGSITKVASIEGSIASPSLSTDGRRIAFVGTLRGRPIRSYSQSDLWVTDTAPGSTPKNLTADYDFDVAGGIGGDQSAPRGQNRKPIVWSPDGRKIAIVSAEHGSSNLKLVDVATGRVTPLTDAAQDVVAYSATAQGNRFAATFSTQTNIGDVFLLDYSPTSTEPHRLQLTHVNDDT